MDGYIYGSAYKGKWVCLDWNSGKTMYAEAGAGKGSLTYADGMLYTLSENGKMLLVRAKPEHREVVGKFKIPKGGEGLSWAYPVVCGGRLYIRHGDFLYAYDIREEVERRRLGGQTTVYRAGFIPAAHRNLSRRD